MIDANYAKFPAERSAGLFFHACAQPYTAPYRLLAASAMARRDDEATEPELRRA